jgi:EAL domain-containing protein (putative c-di-GMP-specific phosphodiesterase class I)
MVEVATESMHLGSMELFPDISVGMALFPEHGSTAADLIRRADIAMYDAKQARAPLVVYSAGRDASYLRRFSLINDLRRAVTHDELRVHYQPKVQIGEHCPTHVEALMRWQHPTEGLLAPDDFIPLAEHAGSIHLLTDWMLRTVIHQCRDWSEAGFDLSVAVNLSAMDLAIGTLPNTISGYLKEYGVPAGRLLLEVTESTIMRDAGHALDVLLRLKACGVHLAIDDFGTGYSSLAHLKRLPVDEIKIDKSFVMSMTHDADDAVIVRSTIELAHNMGLSVVAEGVEDADALEMLSHYQCDMAQGYLISRPLPAVELTDWLVRRCAGSPLPHLHRRVEAGA